MFDSLSDSIYRAASRLKRNRWIMHQNGTGLLVSARYDKYIHCIHLPVQMYKHMCLPWRLLGWVTCLLDVYVCNGVYRCLLILVQISG